MAADLILHNDSISSSNIDFHYSVTQYTLSYFCIKLLSDIFLFMKMFTHSLRGYLNFTFSITCSLFIETKLDLPLYGSTKVSLHLNKVCTLFQSVLQQTSTSLKIFIFVLAMVM